MLCIDQQVEPFIIIILYYSDMLCVVQLNDSFNFPQGWIKYIIIVIVNFLTIATETDLEIIADFLKPVKKETGKRETFFMLIQLLK